MTQSKILFTGSGGHQPSFSTWQDSNSALAPAPVYKYSPGYSVYAIAVSPNGIYAASGTKAGLISVHELKNCKPAEGAKPVFDTFHYPSVTSLAFLTDELFASGGLKGKIIVWSLIEKAQAAEIRADEKAVFALRSLGSRVLASIGADNHLKIWDMDTLQLSFQIDAGMLPRIRSLISLEYEPRTGSLMHGSHTGEIVIYDVRNDFARRTIHAHKGDFCALACGIDKVATGGMADGFVRVWSPDFEKPLHEIQVHHGVLSISWINKTRLAVVIDDGSVQILDITDHSAIEQRSAKLDIRVCAGLPPELVRKKNLQENTQWRQAQFDEAKNLLSRPDADSQKRVTEIIDSLMESGCTGEAVLLLSESARILNRPLWQIEALLALEKGIQDPNKSLPLLYTLGDLLYRVKEPELAMDYFEKIHAIDPAYQDVNNRIVQVQTYPLFRLSVENGVRGDLIKKGLMAQELEKKTLLRQKYNYRTIYHKKKPAPLDSHVDLKQAAEAVNEKLSADDSNAQIKHVEIASNAGKRDVELMIVSCPLKGEGFDYGVEIRNLGRRSEAVGYAIFNPHLLAIPESLDPAKHNNIINQAWHTAFKSPEANSWFADTHSQVFGIIKGFSEVTTAETSGQY
jgi:tetratricopeptide (TPR) repeat protein